MNELAELMARDPLGLSDQDIETIVAKLREAQAQFELGTKGAGTVTKAPTKKSTKTQELLKDLGLSSDDILGDLGLK